MSGTETTDRLELRGVLADRDSWEATNCPMKAALDVIGTKSSMLILREAYYGARRFDEFTRRVGITDAVASTRLRELTEAGVLSRQPYQEPGQRTRYEYRLTQMGLDLLPVVIGLLDWGSRYLSAQPGGPLNVAHRECGETLHAEIRCEAGHQVPIDQISVRRNRRTAG